jgi:diguanylate cyclase (GGDEF)-like protein
MQDISRAAARRKFLALSANGPDEARDIAGAAMFSGVIMDFDRGAVEQSQALALLLRELPGTRLCPLIVIADSPNFSLRLAAAHSGASLLLPKPISGDKLVAALQSLDVRDTPEHPRLLLLSTDEAEAPRLDKALESLGMTVSPFQEAEQIVEALEATQPAALIVDRQATRAEDVCRIVRAVPRWRDLPILLRVTSEAARLTAYEAGADDALLDSASNRELVGRLRVRLERTRVFREQSNRDPLTGLLTRRALTESMQARLAEAQRAKRHLSVCFLDIDRFKQVNDTYGHAVGDKVLASFGALLGSRFRLPDLRGRWGGEEFLVAFYGEWAESAREILSRATAEFAHMTFEGGAGQRFQVTVSGGIATYPVDGETLEDLVLVADQRLYAAKLAGRNRIRI